MKTLFFFTNLLISSICFALPFEENIEDYVATYSNIAVSEMERTGIPASITLSQGILESKFGTSMLATQANNHFGIKCHGWEGEKIYHDDDRNSECFRKYPSALESFYDHSEFLANRQRYATLFTYEKEDYTSWAHGLKKAGYATNPKYADMLIRLIEEYDLAKYDKATVSLVVEEEVPAVVEKPVIVQEQAQVTEKEPVIMTYEPPVAEKANPPATTAQSATVKKEKSPKIKPEKTPKIVVPTNIIYYNHIRTYVANEQQSLQTIADETALSLDKILKYNEAAAEWQPQRGEKIYLQPKRKKAEELAHRVNGNETMYQISQLYGIKLESLLEKNILEAGDEPAVGELIQLRKEAEAPPRLRSGGNSLIEKQIDLDSVEYYQVKEGDTLYSIAKENGLDVEELMKINQLKNANLNIGDQIVFN